MGLRTPASWIQGGSHSAENDRLTERAEVSGAGIINAGDLAVAANGTPNMSVNVAAGAAYIKGSVTATQGYYKAASDATVNVAVTASDPTNPRIDLVCLTVRDAQYAGVNNDVILQVIAGTPAATPAAPAAPANSLVLAQIAVAALAASITNGNITDKRTYVQHVNSCSPCTSSTRPSNPRPGQFIYETDTGRVYQWQALNSRWVAISDGTDIGNSSFTPQASTAGTWTVSSAVGRYKVVNGILYAWGFLTGYSAGGTNNNLDVFWNSIPAPQGSIVTGQIIGHGQVIGGSKQAFDLHATPGNTHALAVNMSGNLVTFQPIAGDGVTYQLCYPVV